MKILTFKYGEIKNPGGINKTIIKINSELAKMGHECTVITTNLSGFPSEEFYEGFKIIRIKSRLGNYFYGFSLGMYLYLKKHFKDLNPDIVHVHGYHGLSSPEVIFILKRLKKIETPIIFSPHFGISSHDTLAGKFLWKPFNELIGRQIMKYPKKIIAASNFEANNINRILGVSLNRIVVIPHGVDIIDMEKNYRNDNKINLLYVGYLLELKGVQYIIEALKELIHMKGADVFLTIVGKGTYEDKLKELANELNVNKYIDWKGYIFSKELMEEFKKADIFLLMSRSENFGIVVTESLALGTPVIITKTTALTEFLNEPGCFGVDYPPDSSQVAELILKIHNDGINVGPFSNRIRTWDKVAKDYENAYKR